MSCGALSTDCFLCAAVTQRAGPTVAAFAPLSASTAALDDTLLFGREVGMTVRAEGRALRRPSHVGRLSFSSVSRCLNSSWRSRRLLGTDLLMSGALYQQRWPVYRATRSMHARVTASAKMTNPTTAPVVGSHLVGHCERASVRYVCGVRGCERCVCN
jgi:hypothetical protein